MRMNTYMSIRNAFYSWAIFISAWIMAWCVYDYEIKSFEDIASKSLITLFAMIIIYPLTALSLGAILRFIDKKIRQKLRLSL